MVTICLLKFCLCNEQIFISRPKQSPYITTNNIDDPEEFRYLRYSSPIKFSFEPYHSLVKEADYFNTFNDKNVFLNHCVNSQNSLPLYQQISALIKCPEIQFSIPSTQHILTIFCKPIEYLKIKKNNKIITLGHYNKFIYKNNELIFMYRNGDTTPFQKKYSGTVVFYPHDERQYKRIFLEKQGHFKFRIGLPELLVENKQIGLVSLTRNMAERIKNNWSTTFQSNVPLQSQKEHINKVSQLKKTTITKSQNLVNNFINKHKIFSNNNFNNHKFSTIKNKDLMKFFDNNIKTLIRNTNINNVPSSSHTKQKKASKKKSNDNLNTTLSPENFNDSNSIL